jgi:hypothetical protein
MSQEPTLADRVAALEREIAVLKMRQAQVTTPPDWLDQISGIMKDEPAFTEVVRLGKEFRDSVADFPEEGS